MIFQTEGTARTSKGPEAGKRLIRGRAGRDQGGWSEDSSGRKGIGSGRTGPVGCTEE